MGVNRFFFPQEALDAWLDQGRVSLEGDIMTFNPEGQRFRLQGAVRFLSEVAGGGDAKDLVGKVKTKAQLGQLGGEQCADSVVLGEDAYQVVEGFVGVPLLDSTMSIAMGDTMVAATRAATGEDIQGDRVDPLTRLFMQRR
jgi:hypothetical protein